MQGPMRLNEMLGVRKTRSHLQEEIAHLGILDTGIEELEYRSKSTSRLAHEFMIWMVNWCLSREIL